MQGEMKTSDVAREEARIKSAYQKTKPAGYYSWVEVGNLFGVQERERLLPKRLRERAFSKSLAGQGTGCGNSSSGAPPRPI
jgi:hypothetical protein